MRSTRVAALIAAALIAPALPSLAAPSVPVVTPLLRTVDVALGTTVASLTDERLVGVTWTSGQGRVRARWHYVTGSPARPAGWGPWTAVEDDSAEPEPAERAHTRPGTDPLWRPAGADSVQLDVAGTAKGLQLVRVTDGLRKVVRGLTGGVAEAATTRGLLGSVGSRADWGADESLRSGSPDYASTVKAVTVHHTANGNDYSRSEVPSIIRADYAYHVKSRGWSDLGYNLVVDKFGGIWEGRAGGIGRPVIGAHAQGFNTGTLGVSLIGDMTRAAPTPEALAALTRVTAFAAATWSFDPTSSVTLRSGGSPKFKSGSSVTLHRVFGHKETGTTACPGVLMDSLDDLRAGALKLLGPAPKILTVDVTQPAAGLASPVTVDGTLSEESPWRVALRDSDGTVVANAEGTGTAPSLTWAGLVPLAAGLPAVAPAPSGTYTWTVVADDGLHPASRRTGTVRVRSLLGG
ncbi:MAG: repeat protein [Frankiales bacterium]|nr:repeat protein [Frankiales bacterium]